MIAILKDTKALFSSRNWTITLSSLAIFMSFSPFFTWGMPISIGGIAILTIFLLNLQRLRISSSIWVILFALLYVILACRGNYSLAGFVLLLLLCVFLFIDEKILNHIYNSFVTIFSFLCLISFVAYFLVVILELPLSPTPIDPLNGGKTNIGIYYFQYPFLVVSESTALPILRYRFCGFFDEPGVIGTIAGACLLINNFNLKKWYNFVLFIIGMFSMSLYFFIIVFLFAVFASNTKYRLLLLFIFGVLLFFLWNNEIVSTLVINRFLGSDGGISFNNNREHFSEQWWNHFVKSDSFLMGLGSGTSMVVNEGGSSYKNIIIDYGVIYFMSYVIIYWLMAKAKIKNLNHTIRCFIVFFSILFQRPYIDTCGFFFLMYAPIIVISSQLEKYGKKNSNPACNV